MKKYYAEYALSVDGRQYNSGDIVYYHKDLPGLRRAPDEVIEVVRKKYPISSFINNFEPTISVIVTFHNQEKFIRKCLSAFLRQSIRVPYEIIAVIDSSSQREADIIRSEYKSNVQLVELKDVCNAAKARNKGMEEAQGDFLVFFDGDDYPYGEFLQKMFEVIVENDENFSFSYSRFDSTLFPANGSRLPRCGVFEYSNSWAKISPPHNTPIMIIKDIAPKWDERFEIMQDFSYGLTLEKNKINGIHVRERLWEYINHDQSVWHEDIKDKKEKALKILNDEYEWKNEKAELTFVSLISRDNVLDEYFSQIPTLGLPENTHWFIIIDSNDEKLIERVKELSCETNEKINILSTRMYVTAENSLEQSRDFEARGMRIANFIKIIINQAAERIGGSDYIFMIEDDTIAPKNAYKRLIEGFNDDDRLAYFSGIEAGRGYTKHTGVCYLREDTIGNIIARDIPLMKKLGIEQIDGGGWYCWIGKTDILKSFIDQYPMRCFDGKMLGPDVMMVHDLRKAGYDCMVDFSVQCKHYDPRDKRWIEAMEGRGYDVTFKKNNGKFELVLNEKHGNQ